MLASRLGAGLAALAAVTGLVAATPVASAISGWTLIPVPPSGQNASPQSVSAASDTSAWAVGDSSGAAYTGLGSHALIDHWNGAAWSQAAAPSFPAGTSVRLQAVAASGPADAWAVGYRRVQRYQFTPLALRWNGTAWSISPSGSTALPGDTTMDG